jgi:hypothetical protein
MPSVSLVARRRTPQRQTLLPISSYKSVVIKLSLDIVLSAGIQKGPFSSQHNADKVYTF